MIIVNRVSTKTYQVDSSTGDVTAQESTGGAAHVADQSQLLTSGLLDDSGAPKTVPTTDYSRHANDVPDYTGHTTQAPCEAAEVVQRTFGADVDGVVITCWGSSDFKGVYVTLSSTALTTTQAAARLSSVNTDTAIQRHWIGAGERVFIPFPGLSQVSMVAINAGTIDNNIDLVSV